MHFACELGAAHFAVFEGSEGSAPPFRTSGGVMPGIAVPSLDAAFQAAQSIGASVVEPPSEYPWGPRMLVEDPDGRTVEFFERRED